MWNHVFAVKEVNASPLNRLCWMTILMMMMMVIHLPNNNSTKCIIKVPNINECSPSVFPLPYSPPVRGRGSEAHRGSLSGAGHTQPADMFSKYRREDEGGERPFFCNFTDIFQIECSSVKWKLNFNSNLIVDFQLLQPIIHTTRIYFSGGTRLQNPPPSAPPECSSSLHLLLISHLRISSSPLVPDVPSLA